MESAPLTDDEKTILTRLRRGDSQGVIAYDLCCDPRTVRRKMANIRKVIAAELI
jgi:DNA-binding CsgD family transcriptional regulator